MAYYEKYLKYKKKYLLLRKQYGNMKGGALETMPKLCFGTAQDNLDKMLKLALDHGITHIDGAEGYQYGKSHGIIRECIKLIPRENLWITWKADKITVEMIKAIITKLSCGYIDTFLVHHDSSCIAEDDFVQLQKAQKDGLIRFFGVSNCENFERIQYLRENYGISTIQIQSRPPGGEIKYRPKTESDFIEKCNGIGINVMLFASVSGIIGIDDLTDYSIFTEIYEQHNINKYYLQKYCYRTNNVLIISSVSGSSIKQNKEDSDAIERGDKLLDDSKMKDIETKLLRLTLNLQ